MGLTHRPYIGTWKLEGRDLVQHTPDALVYINGDTSIPGCPKCNSRIDIQQFLTEVSVDAGTEAGSASASITLSIPIHHNDSFARDARFILRPGLEVHVYMRGYFPVMGLYSNLAEPQLDPSVSITTSTQGLYQRSLLLSQEPVEVDNAAGSISYTDGEVRSGGSAAWRARNPGNLIYSEYAVSQGATAGQWLEWRNKEGELINKFAVFPTEEQGRAAIRTMMRGAYAKLTIQEGMAKYAPATQKGNNPTIYAARLTKAVGVPVTTVIGTLDAEQMEAFLDEIQQVEGWREGTISARVVDDTEFVAPEASEARLPKEGPSLLQQYGLEGQGIEDVIAYPYYHVFHGVTTEVGHSYSAGVSTVTINCSSMLHFWQYQNMSTNASVFGARPTNSKLKMSMVGHNFTGMHPYQIMYSLHYDMVGAAGGVGWALSQKDNQTAVSEVGRESLFSLNIKYWERRFGGSNIRLRLHGANGELFSAMQAAWLGRTSSANLTSLLRYRYDTAKRPNNLNNVATESLFMGMSNPRKMEALIVAKRSQPGATNNAPGFEINLVEMQAFVSNIGNWGQIQLFESTYQSKLDIANTVCEITGFEFFQDVDGDFVFKPPFFNLDTSGSRVYRIEDIDLININFSSKEPAVTYMTVKGSPFANLQGTGTENEWGVRGQYIDYRLVAQFGWRPGSYDTAYFNDPKSMFFSAVNRLDVMNVGMNTASVTIPIRPEMRPGYPVYIPYLDCYYYCNSFSHSYSVGGQCTTTLQLVGRRAKFYAPGLPGQKGIGAIDLENTTLPEKPLQVLGNDGQPRLSGFPNVVMALDPKAVNPLFFVVGIDIERIDDLRVIKWLLKIGVQERFLYFSKGTDTQPSADSAAGYITDKPRAPTDPLPAETEVGTGYYMMKDAANQWVTFYFNDDEQFRAKAQGDTDPAAPINIMQVAVAYSESLEKQGTALEKKKTSITEEQRKIDDLQYQVQELGARLRHTPETDEGARKKLTDQMEALNAKILAAEQAMSQTAAVIEQEKRTFEDSVSSGGVGRGVALLKYLLDKVGERYRLSRPGSFGDLTSSTSLLDMLSDKKAMFSNGTQPGSYRYYSSAHPKPEHQGQAELTYSKSDTVGEGGSQVKEGQPALVTVEVTEVPTYSDVAVAAPQPGMKSPEAELVLRRPVAGIRVLNSNSQAPGGEVTPTDQIHELMFSVQDVTLIKREWYTAEVKSAGLGKKAEAVLDQRFRLTSAPPGSSFSTLYQGLWNQEMQKAAAGIPTLAQYELGALATPPGLPASVSVLSRPIQMGWNSSQVGYAGNTAKPLLATWKKPPALQEFLDALGGALGKAWAYSVRTWSDKIQAAVAKKAKKAAAGAEASKAVLAGASTSLGAEVTTTEKVRAERKVSKKEKTYSPVFPVSDEKGYEVIGSYRYGRGCDVDAQGVFSQIAAQDPFSLLDRYTVEKILRLIVQKQTRGKVATKTVQKGKTKATVPVVDDSGPDINTSTDANQALLDGLRKAGLTDKQILDYRGLLTSTTDLNVLQINAANWFATGKEGPLKLPLNNSAYSLGDLTPVTDQQVCSCKAAEADMLLEAFGQSAFLSLEPDTSSTLGLTPGDQVTGWMRQQTTLAAGPWKVSQDALRGTALDRGTDSVTTSVLDTIDQIDATRRRLSQQAEQIAQEASILVQGGREPSE